MKQYIPLQITITDDSDSRVNPDEFYRFIEINLEDVQTYWMDPDRAKSRDLSASVDYIALVNTAASVACLAQLFWNAYKKFFGEKGLPHNDSLGFYIHLPDGTYFWLGNEYTDRDVFIKEFTSQVTELQQRPNAVEKSTIEIETMVRSNDKWIRRK